MIACLRRIDTQVDDRIVTGPRATEGQEFSLAVAVALEQRAPEDADGGFVAVGQLRIAAVVKAADGFAKNVHQIVGCAQATVRMSGR